MSKETDRMVYKNAKGEWVNKKISASKASSIHNTQKEAEIAARGMLKKQGGGELITKGINGKIRSKDTIGSGNDPRSIKDTEN